MSLWLNKKEHEYLMKVVEEDLDTDETYYNELISVEEREKLLKKIKDMKV
jgi:HKD family nuclease